MCACVCVCVCVCVHVCVCVLFGTFIEDIFFVALHKYIEKLRTWILMWHYKYLSGDASVFDFSNFISIFIPIIFWNTCANGHKMSLN